MHEDQPEKVLEDQNDVSVVIGGTFELSDGAVLAGIYWRPDGVEWDSTGREPLPKSTSSTEPVRGAVVETEKFINLKLFDAISKHLEQISKDEVNNALREASTLARERKYEKALEIASRVLEKELDDTQKYQAHYNVGFRYKNLGQLDLAWEHMTQAHELNEGNDSAVFEQGNIAFLQDKLDLAESLYVKVRDKGESNADKARWNLALVYQTQGAWDKALEELDALPEKSVHEFNKSSLYKTISDTKERIASAEKRRAVFFRRLMIGLVILGVIAVSALIFVLYRRLQKTSELTVNERADYTGKLMSGLFNLLSLLGGTMLGAMLTK